ncbi:MAG: zinc ribbon domain-containing protein [Acidimicrobiales bacterium]|nr:zinc ribbon domain-containing protein [Acidimicrobiales bacterium]
MAELCGRCGVSLPDGVSFCPQCGAAAAAASAPVPTPAAWPSEPPPFPPTAFTAPPGPPPPWASTPPPAALLGPEPAAVSRNTIAGVIGVVGALVLGVASFLAWAQVTLSLETVRTQSVSGWDWFDNGVQSGPVLALLALAGAGLGGLLLGEMGSVAVRLAVVAVGALSLGVVAYAVSAILTRQEDVQVVGNVAITFSVGIWLVAAGAVALMVAGLVATHRAPSPT